MAVVAMAMTIAMAMAVALDMVQEDPAAATTTAIRAMKQARATRHAAHASGPHRAAMRAGRTIRPARGFKPFAGLIFVVKDGIGQIDVHGSKDPNLI